MSKIFKRGYGAVQEEAERQEQARENAGRKLFRFFLQNDGDEAEIRFLTEEPINYNSHSIKGLRNGKEFFEDVACSGDDCPLCVNGDKSSFKSAFLIYDTRPWSYTDRSTGKEKKGEGQLRLYTAGARVVSQLMRLSERYGLTKRRWTVIRSGKGTNTTYSFDRGDALSKLTKEEITNMIPEKLRDKYDGTADSLYGIVEEQIEMMAPSSEDDTPDDDLDNNSRSNLVNYEDEEEDKPEKKPSFKKSSGASKPQKKSSVFRSK